MNAKAAANAAATATDVEGLQVFMLRQNQFRSQDDSSISARPSLLLQHLHETRATETTTVSDAATDPDRQDRKHDRRCGSVGDRGTSRGVSSGVSGIMGMIMPMPKPNKPEPVEICIDFERIQCPVEYGALAKVAMI